MQVRKERCGWCQRVGSKYGRTANAGDGSRSLLCHHKPPQLAPPLLPVVLQPVGTGGVSRRPGCPCHGERCMLKCVKVCGDGESAQLRYREEKGRMKNSGASSLSQDAQVPRSGRAAPRAKARKQRVCVKIQSRGSVKVLRPSAWWWWRGGGRTTRLSSVWARAWSHDDWARA